MTASEAWTLWRARPRLPARSTLWANVLFLKPCAYQVFLPFLEERFPELVRKYRERYDRAAYLRGAYPEMIQERVERIRKRHGLDRKSDRPEPELWPHDPQLRLFDRSVRIIGTYVTTSLNRLRHTRLCCK